MAAVRQPLYEVQPGDVLSPSSANTYLKCSAQFLFRKILRLPDPPTGALVLGAAVHAAVEFHMMHKLNTSEDLPVEESMVAYADAWKNKAQEAEFRADEDPADLLNQGQILAVKYLTKVASTIQPAAVEEHVSGILGGVQVQGYIDLIDAKGTIIDLKTAARKPSEISADYRFQIATYAQLSPQASGEARLDTLTKTKRPELIQQSFRIDQSDVLSTEKLYPLVQDSIRAGVFVPNRGSHLCSRKYCSFWRQCEREYGGKVAE